MKLFFGFLLIATVLCNNNGGSDTSRSSLKSNQISNDLIIHHTKFNDILNHLAVDLPTGKMFFIFDSSSALCVYSLDAIRRKFTQNIQACQNGYVLRGLDLPKTKCVPTEYKNISEYFCGMDINAPFGGDEPITAVPVTLIPHQLTSVAATSTSGSTVVFIGTIEGHLKKMVIESPTSAIEIMDIVIDEGSKVNADMHFVTHELNLYVMTMYKVAKVRVHHCNLFQNCTDCLRAKDPYCGWCLSEGKCSLRSSCPDDTNDPLFWISYKTSKCTTIKNESSHQLQPTTNPILKSLIDHLPAQVPQFFCAFTTTGGRKIYTYASSKIDKVSCTKPKWNSLKQFAPGKQYFTTISVETFNGPDLVSIDLTLFGCSTYSSCILCSFFPLECDWCVQTHLCIHDLAKYCRNDTLFPTVSVSIDWFQSCALEFGTCYFGSQSTESTEVRKDFVDPQIEDFFPKFGPISGDTPVTIIGKHLNAGSRIKAFIDEKPCEILSANETQALCRTGPAKSQSKGKLKMTFDNSEREFNKATHEYVKDPTIEHVSCDGLWKSPRGIPAGGIKITVGGNQFGAFQQPKMYVQFMGKTYLGKCKVVSNTMMHCYSPRIDNPENLDLNLNADSPTYLNYGFKMDDFIELRNKDIHRPFELYPNPVYLPFDENVKKYKSKYLTINGRNLDLVCLESDLVVKIGNGVCNITSLLRHQLTCRPPKDVADSIEASNVSVTVGNVLTYKIGVLSYASPNIMDGRSRHTLFAVIAGVALILLIFVVLLVVYRKKTNESKKIQSFIKLQITAECEEAFAALQIELSDLIGDLTSVGIPFLDYRTYAMKILFPNSEDDCAIEWQRPELLHKEEGLQLFGQLLMNKTFLLHFIRTLESNRYLSMSEPANVASLIMVTLQSNMEYCTDILKTLLAELIKKSVDRKSHPKLLLRRNESVAEKMLSAWFTFFLYKFLKECAGEPLYMLFRAVKGQVDKGPVDAITHEARYSLSEEKLIHQFIEFKVMTVYASIVQQPIIIGDNMEMLPRNPKKFSVKVLDCDSISQVKEKCLDSIYLNTPWSQRPCGDDLDLEWHFGASYRVNLYDEDTTSKLNSEWTKLNTLNHYQVPDGAYLCLVSKQGLIYNLSTFSDKSQQQETFLEYAPFNPPLNHTVIPSNNESLENGLRWWHLVNHHDIDCKKERKRRNKMTAEIYLTLLLATANTLQKYVDDLFKTIFSTVQCGSAFPLAIKYMFDFLDYQAVLHGITDPEIVNTWKSNSLPLNFWTNLIKNPNLVFDIHKSNVVDSCLSVVVQAVMDSCSTSNYTLDKDLHSSELLYAKNIPKYRRWVDEYYSHIRGMPVVSDQDMNVHMKEILAEVSTMYPTEINTNWALLELYKHAAKQNDQLTLTLDTDENHKLAYKLKEVHNILSSDMISNYTN